MKDRGYRARGGGAKRDGLGDAVGLDEVPDAGGEFPGVDGGSPEMEVALDEDPDGDQGAE